MAAQDNPVETMNVRTKLYGNPFNICGDISGWPKVICLTLG